MKLPFALPFGSKENKQYFLALLLQDEKIGAVVLEESAGILRVVGHAEEYFKTSLEEAGFEELLETIDKSVSIAEESLPDGIQTQKTVFGVKQDWVVDGKIKKDYLATLKKVCDELSFQPMGFLVFTEAILHRLQQEEGAPVSAILVEVGKKLITLSLVRAGRIIETQVVPLQIPITHTVDSTLKEFSVEVLPSRVILFLSEKDTGVSHAFISHTWSKNLPFLHVPQVTVLPAGFDTKSVLYGTAAQMNFTVSGNFSLPSKTFKSPKANLEEIPEESEEIEEELEEKEEFTEKKTESKHSAAEKQPQHLTALEDDTSADFFGFVSEKDITSTKPGGVKKATLQSNDDVFEEIPEVVKEHTTNFQKSDNFTTQATLLTSGIKDSLTKFLNTIHVEALAEKVENVFDALPLKTKRGKSILPGNKLLFIIPAAVIVALVGFIFYIFSVSAQVTVSITPKILDDSRQVTFALDSSSDVSSNTLGVQTVSADEKDSITQDTTGTKEVGTPAKGQITIFSTLTKSSTIAKGTKIVSDNNTSYTLDSDVTVASSSGNAGDFITVANINVTASDIGPAGNLPSGTRFSINGFSKSDVSGKNDNPFSGGTKKDVRVVSQADIDKISGDLVQNLSAKAKDDMSKSLSKNTQLLPLFIKQDLSDQTLSNKLNEEAKNLTLSATVHFQGVSVSKDDLVSFAKQALSDKLSSGMTIPPDGIVTDVSNVKQDKTSITAQLQIKAKAIPMVDVAALEKSIAGKSFADAIAQIKTLPQIQDVTIDLNPSLPFLPKALPRLANHIKIFVKPNE